MKLQSSFGPVVVMAALLAISGQEAAADDAVEQLKRELTAAQEERNAVVEIAREEVRLQKYGSREIHPHLGISHEEEWVVVPYDKEELDWLLRKGDEVLALRPPDWRLVIALTSLLRTAPPDPRIEDMATRILRLPWPAEAARDDVLGTWADFPMGAATHILGQQRTISAVQTLAQVAAPPGSRADRLLRTEEGAPVVGHIRRSLTTSGMIALVYGGWGQGPQPPELAKARVRALKKLARQHRGNPQMRSQVLHFLNYAERRRAGQPLNEPTP